MTGFGQATDRLDGVQYLVELRSLNNRFFKSAIRLPEAIGGLDAELDTLLRRHFSRGSVTLVVKMSDPPENAAGRVNQDVIHTYLEQVQAVLDNAPTLHNQASVTVDLATLLNLPGVLDPAEDAIALLDRVRPLLLKLTEDACAALTVMRREEGKRLISEFVEHSRVIREHAARIIDRAPAVVDEYHARLQTRVDELLRSAKLELSQADLLREIAIFAERADIREETSRMSAHLDQLDQMVADENTEPIGRKLEFLTQELLREANTIASKSNDAEISKAIVVVKSAIDRIKEQAQNVE